MTLVRVLADLGFERNGDIVDWKKDNIEELIAAGQLERVEVVEGEFTPVVEETPVETVEEPTPEPEPIVEEVAPEPEAPVEVPVVEAPVIVVAPATETPVVEE